MKDTLSFVPQQLTEAENTFVKVTFLDGYIRPHGLKQCVFFYEPSAFETSTARSSNNFGVNAMGIPSRLSERSPTSSTNGPNR